MFPPGSDRRGRMENADLAAGQAGKIDAESFPLAIDVGGGLKHASRLWCQFGGRTCFPWPSMSGADWKQHMRGGPRGNTTVVHRFPLAIDVGGLKQVEVTAGSERFQIRLFPLAIDVGGGLKTPMKRMVLSHSEFGFPLAIDVGGGLGSDTVRATSWVVHDARFPPGHRCIGGGLKQFRACNKRVSAASFLSFPLAKQRCRGRIETLSGVRQE